MGTKIDKYSSERSKPVCLLLRMLNIHRGQPRISQCTGTVCWTYPGMFWFLASIQNVIIVDSCGHSAYKADIQNKRRRRRKTVTNRQTHNYLRFFAESIPLRSLPYLNKHSATTLEAINSGGLEWFHVDFNKRMLLNLLDKKRMN